MSKRIQEHFVFSVCDEDITLKSGDNESTTSIDLHPNTSDGDAEIARIFTYAGNFAVELTKRGYDAERFFSVLPGLMKILDECIPNNSPSNYTLNSAAIANFMHLLGACKE